MSAGAAAVPPPADTGPRIRLCRGCCCGTTRKHPDIGHASIELVLASECGPAAELIRTECMWACELSNLVVVNPSTEGRRAGARAAWVRHVNTVQTAQLLADWVCRGGPGVAEPPPALGEIRTGADLNRTRTRW